MLVSFEHICLMLGSQPCLALHFFPGSAPARPTNKMIHQVLWYLYWYLGTCQDLWVEKDGGKRERGKKRGLVCLLGNIVFQDQTERQHVIGLALKSAQETASPSCQIDHALLDCFVLGHLVQVSDHNHTWICTHLKRGK